MMEFLVEMKVSVFVVAEDRAAAEAEASDRIIRPAKVVIDDVFALPPLPPEFAGRAAFRDEGEGE